MTKIGKLWTGAVAYVSLLVGAGLSVAGNLADTYRIRATDMDTVDIVLAVGPPIAALLVAELFVSDWPPVWSLQSLRWVGTVVVGGLATVVSWSHINELLIARGQNELASILWPLAIDGLALMAVAKILAMRVHGHGPADSADTGRPVDMPMAAASGHSMDTPNIPADTSTGRPVSELDAWEQGYEDALSTAGQQLANEVDSYVSAVSAPLPQRTRTSAGVSVPADAADLIRAWEPASEKPGDMVRRLAASFGVSTRTVTRWRSAILGPVSGPPAG